MDLGLRDRVYLVTGGSRGLGFAAAQTLVADGARVVLSAPHEATASSAAARLTRNAAAGHLVAWVIADNADPATPDRLIGAASERFGRMDGALISVGGSLPTLAGELGPAGIRVNGVLPVRIATDRVRELDALRGDPDEVRARLSEHIPLRRYGEPEEFGRAAASLLSPAASYALQHRVGFRGVSVLGRGRRSSALSSRYSSIATTTAVSPPR